MINIALEHETEQYVNAFTAASDRVRRLILIAIVASILGFAAFWNSQDKTWWNERLLNVRIAVRNKVWEPGTEARLQACLADPRRNFSKVGFLDSCDEIDHAIKVGKDKRHGEHSWKVLLQELEARRTGDMTMVSVPFLGVHFDVNDLGVFSALGLMVISFTLAFAIARQHENLYLCLWKVRRIAEQENLYDDGQSTANFFYHSLAMAQVFSRPPTLARWRPGVCGRLAVQVLFLMPAVAQALIWWNDRATLSRARSMIPGFAVLSMRMQSLLLLAIIVCNFVSCCYMRADDIRWKRTFFRINPGLRAAKQPSWWRFMLLYPPGRRKPTSTAILKAGGRLPQPPESAALS